MTLCRVLARDRLLALQRGGGHGVPAPPGPALRPASGADRARHATGFSMEAHELSRSCSRIHSRSETLGIRKVCFQFDGSVRWVQRVLRVLSPCRSEFARHAAALLRGRAGGRHLHARHEESSRLQFLLKYRNLHVFGVDGLAVEIWLLTFPSRRYIVSKSFPCAF